MSELENIYEELNQINENEMYELFGIEKSNCEDNINSKIVVKVIEPDKEYQILIQSNVLLELIKNVLIKIN